MAHKLPEPDTAPEPTPATSSPPRTQYEFNEEENKVFESVATNLRLGGWSIIVLVVTYHVVLLGRWALGGPPMYDRFQAFQIWVPWLLLVGSATLIRAGWAFDRVVNTQGSDVTHLMDGLKSLNEVFSWLPIGWLFILLAIVVGVGMAVIHAFGF